MEERESDLCTKQLKSVLQIVHPSLNVFSSPNSETLFSKVKLYCTCYCTYTLVRTDQFDFTFCWTKSNIETLGKCSGTNEKSISITPSEELEWRSMKHWTAKSWLILKIDPLLTDEKSCSHGLHAVWRCWWSIGVKHLCEWTAPLQCALFTPSVTSRC